MKQKTKSAAAKRFKVSSKGKVQHLPPNRSHFNGGDTGDESRRKRGNTSISATDRQRVQELLPYAAR